LDLIQNKVDKSRGRVGWSRGRLSRSRGRVGRLISWNYIIRRIVVIKRMSMKI